MKVRSLSDELRRVARTVVVASLLAAACTPLPGQGEPPQLFTLTPKSTFPDDLPSVNWQLLVEVPVAGDSLNTDHIALQESPLTLDYYAKARWTEPGLST